MEGLDLLPAPWDANGVQEFLPAPWDTNGVQEFLELFGMFGLWPCNWTHQKKKALFHTRPVSGIYNKYWEGLMWIQIEVIGVRQTKRVKEWKSPEAKLDFIPSFTSDFYLYSLFTFSKNHYKNKQQDSMFNHLSLLYQKVFSFSAYAIVLVYWCGDHTQIVLSAQRIKKIAIDLLLLSYCYLFPSLDGQ